MESVIRTEENRKAPAQGNQVARLPRRGTDPRDQAPITVDERTESLGHSLVVAGVPEEAAALRRRIASLAALPPRAGELVQDLASELFNNSVVHSRSGTEGGEVTVTLNRLKGRVQVKVTDQGPRDPGSASPHVRDLDLDREGGLGLRLVAAQAARWGTFHENGRTTVWFELDRPGARRGEDPTR